MTKLDEIRERHKAIKKVVIQHGWQTALRDANRKTYYEDASYLLTLLQSHPASEPPDTDRLVIVRWGRCVGMGQFINDTWRVFVSGAASQFGYPVETWQELPFERG